MTLGYVQREMRALEERVKMLEDSKIIPLFPEQQVRTIAKSYADRAFRRLILWTLAAAFLGSGLMLVLSKL